MRAVRSILFVDDDRLVRQLFSRLLVKRGYRVSWAADRQQAVALFSKQQFDVVIAELHLRSSPDGLDILRGFQKIEPTIGKILITSTDPKAVEASVKALGAVCIPKPVEIDDLLLAIEKVAV